MTSENDTTETALTGQQRTHLRGLGQALKPMVMVGKEGASAAVLKELSGALDREELVKIRLPAIEREEREALVNSLCRETGAQLCGVLGHTATLFKRQADPLKRKIRLPR